MLQRPAHGRQSPVPGPSPSARDPPRTTPRSSDPLVPRVVLESDLDAPGREWQEVEGSLMFLDVSGLTNLSERLARRGRIGTEEPPKSSARSSARCSTSRHARATSCSSSAATRSCSSTSATITRSEHVVPRSRCMPHSGKPRRSRPQSAGSTCACRWECTAALSTCSQSGALTTAGHRGQGRRPDRPHGSAGRSRSGRRGRRHQVSTAEQCDSGGERRRMAPRMATTSPARWRPSHTRQISSEVIAIEHAGIASIGADRACH